MSLQHPERQHMYIKSRGRSITLYWLVVDWSCCQCVGDHNCYYLRWTSDLFSPWATDMWLGRKTRQCTTNDGSNYCEYRKFALWSPYCKDRFDSGDAFRFCWDFFFSCQLGFLLFDGDLKEEAEVVNGVNGVLYCPASFVVAKAGSYSLPASLLSPAQYWAGLQLMIPTLVLIYV